MYWVSMGGMEDILGEGSLELPVYRGSMSGMEDVLEEGMPE